MEIYEDRIRKIKVASGKIDQDGIRIERISTLPSADPACRLKKQSTCW
jgi:hypothetical protein